MNRLTIIALFLLMILPAFLIFACAGSIAPPAPGSAILVFEKDVILSQDGEAVLSLRASAPGTAWNRPQAQAATISVHPDGIYKADVVLFRGETPFAYEVLVGHLSRGTHHLAVFLEPAKSAPQAQVRVDDVAVRVYAPDDPLYRVLAHAPVLYGRDESSYSDTPLFMYHQVTSEAETTTIQYTIIFSHEDGGTAPDGLMARWGRLTDIEWVYRVVLDAQGAVIRGEYQDKDHNTATFHGMKEGQHPFLKDVTRNNLFADVGTSAYRFALVPTESLPDASREEMMDRHPWTYRVMAEEWEREKQELTERDGIPETREVSDPRNYLYVEFKSEPLSNPSCDAKLAIQVKLAGGERWYSSDHGVDNLRIQSQGWRRSAIELPAGTTANQIEALRFVAYPGKNSPSCALVVTDVRKAFLLDQDYVPQPSLLSWHGRQVLDADDTTPYPAHLLLPTANELINSRGKIDSPSNIPIMYSQSNKS
jgi:hypothetical protein